MIVTLGVVQENSLYLCVVDESEDIRSDTRRIVNLSGIELGMILAVEKWG